MTETENLRLTSYTPKARPICLSAYPYSLPKTAPRVKQGDRTPEGTGDERESTINKNCRMQKITKLKPRIG